MGAGLSSAEGRSDQLAPHVRRSATLVVALYSGYGIFGTVGLRLAGMSWFDAVNHSMAAVSTGGFSTRPESVGYWDSPLVEAVTIVLMLVGTFNFLTAWALFRGKLAPWAQNGEIRLMAVLLPSPSWWCCSAAGLALYPTLGKAVRVSVFEVVSALSTTGFSTVGYLNWPALPFLVLIVMMLIGGGTGSTAGGIKQYRVYVLFRALVGDIRRRILPRSAVPRRRSGWASTRASWTTQIREAALFVFLYLVAYWLGVAILTGYGYSLGQSLFEFASAIGTVGLSMGVTAADAPGGVLWAETVGMFLGRLEFFTVFIGVFRVVMDGRAGLEASRA